MPVSITYRAKVATCTQGIFRYTFHVDPKPDSNFIQFLVNTKMATTYTIGPSTFFRVDTSSSLSIQGMVHDPDIIISTRFSVEDVKEFLSTLYSEYEDNINESGMDEPPGR
ncbi:hypothetical protein [Methanospirillum sp.]